MQTDYYPRVVGTEFGLLLGSTSVTYYPSNYPGLLLPYYYPSTTLVAPDSSRPLNGCLLG